MFYAFSGRETLGRPFSYEVELLSDDDSIDLSELLGQKATVALERTDGTIREFNGFVTEFSLVGQHGNSARYRAVMHPWLWFLGQRRNSRIFQEKTVQTTAQYQDFANNFRPQHPTTFRVIDEDASFGEHWGDFFEALDWTPRQVR